MRTEWIRDPARLGEIAVPWAALAAREPWPFAGPAWFGAWWSAFGREGALETCALWDGDELAGLLPAWRDGRRLRAMVNELTPEFRPLARDEVALDALMGAATRAADAELVLGDMEVGPALERAAAQCRRAGRALWLEHGRRSPFVDTRGEFEDWRRATKPRWRANLDRLRRKMHREHDVELVVVEPPRDLQADLARGLAVEASGWKSETGTAIAADPATRAFFEEVAACFHAAGSLRFSWLELDGQMAAFDYALLHGNRLWLHKTGFDPAWRNVAPALVLHLSVIERCFEVGLDALELLGEEDEWKRKFQTGVREHRTLHAAPRASPLALRWAARRGLKPVVRSARRLARRAPAAARAS